MNHLYNGFAKTFDFSGRASRMELFIFGLLFCALLAVAVVIDLSNDWFDPETGIGGATAFLIVAMFMSNLSLSVRRLHDINLSGWFVLVGLIPIVGPLAQISLLFLPGTDGVNDYGPAPH
ncbi:MULTISPECIES: DUF805 domain-containing protein [Pseudomonas]|uniref:Aminopeptidase n=1 Tax=Pseudomonas cichorii TaxID=36746 RepID=A0A3M4VYU3_PSECI|nr:MULTISPECIES: DUF805 domain-containing protein [Pseudomonas]AHF68741.1 hypothetical protein PCH70_35880 [Pseudomonas cichorii JBC1]QVE15739.1 DUF805 domain-containing protein [Pseudomonas cichorii]RMR56890.1 hypothetical protein ALP84_03616 [Pseudomonas cichorii]SDN31737.1 Uncharacterized membrane protein YhaH, DUF805 family [Pseudomonas cichorii]GFM75770.1 aminopeptidase [Pseudomonas cichorii]